MGSEPSASLRVAVDQRNLWYAALQLQLRPAGRAASHDVAPSAWPDIHGIATAGDPTAGGRTGAGLGWLPGLQCYPRGAPPPLEPCSPPLTVPVPVRPRGPVLGSGSSAFRPTAAARQQQAQQVLQYLAAHPPAGLDEAQVPAVHRYDGAAAGSPGLRQGDGPHTPPRCHVSMALQKAEQQQQQQQQQRRQQSKQQYNITASAVSSPADPLHGLLHAVSFMGMYEGQASSPQLRTMQDTAQGGQPPLLQRGVAAAYTSLLTPRHSSERMSRPDSPPTPPPRSCHKGRPGPRSPTQKLLRVQGGVGKAKSPTLQERLQHQQRVARSSASSACTGTSSDTTSGHSGGTADGGATAASSATGSWTEEDKAALLAIVQEVKPCGALEWEAVANRLGRWSKGGASAERMFRTLADPQYQKSSNRHGCRLNPRTGTPMHVMVEFALQHLPGHEGNIDAIAKVIEANPGFARQLDYSARPGTKTYPRWKDTLLGCFKAGRYRHLLNTHVKINGKNVYRLVMPLAHDAQKTQKQQTNGP